MQRDSGVLKQVVLNALLDQIENGTTKATKQGDVVTVSVEAPVLNAAIAFLKQFPPENGEVATDELSSRLKQYLDNPTQMPFGPSNRFDA